MENLREMLQTCQENKLCLNPEKCTFLVPFGNLLGHIVSKEGLLTDPAKVSVILHFLTLSTRKQLKGFLGLTGYYRKFIRGYAYISGPLEELLKKNIEWIWIDDQQRAFETLKQAIVAVLILQFPDWKKTFHVHVDASQYAIGCVLAQPSDDKTDHPIYFASRKLTRA